MKYYAHINSDCMILGWYCKEIHSEIPTPNIPTSEGDWENALAINATHYNKKEKKFISLTPPVTQEELISEAEYQKKEKIQHAAIVIKPLEYAVNLNVATDAEKKLLAQWQLYTVLVNRVDTSTAPDIDWPEMPE